ncbi:uncharacterized protein LOC108045023 [Drosophila rhopaloa]|uniref:Uncharacterized protein LOC108045023 n=1 Tax=Drosophila rhopaloa TaxID=1041015 RepID=A0A6P4ESL0_DRORH|nr:uncharacterized protein LOC108045023 [Drosophila rhopaloa]
MPILVIIPVFIIMMMMISDFSCQSKTSKCNREGTEAELNYKLKKVECDGDPVRVKNISCYVKPINWSTGLVTMDSYLTVPMLNPYIRLQVLKKDYSNQWKPFLIDASFTICEGKKNFYPYGVIFWKLVKSFTNANHSCPFSGHKFARGGYLDSSLFPPFPQGFYQVSLTFTDVNSTHSEFVGTAKFYMEAMEQIKRKTKPGV